MRTQIIADTSCDLTPALANLLRVEHVSFRLNLGEKTFLDDKSLEQKELIAAMKAYNGPATTACPSPEDFAEKMRAAESCFVITISQKLSGCYNSAMVARNMVLEETPDKKIHVFDSESAAAGETRVALFLHHCLLENMEFETIVQKAEKFIETLHTRFVLEDLSNLVKNGRISKAAGLMGTMLNLRPIMADNGHGEIIALEKIRGTQNAMRRLVEMLAESTKDGLHASMTMVITHCNCLERATDLKKEVLEKCAAFAEIILVPTGGLSTVYANNGGIVLAY